MSISDIGETTWEAVYEVAAEATLVVDRDGQILKANDHAAQMFRVPTKELESLSVEDLMAESIRDLHIHLRHEFMQHPRARDMGSALDLRAQRPDGSEFPADISLSPLGKGKHTLLVVSIRNIFERKQAERELLIATERLALLEDRERIAQDLHDTVIQEIFASGLALQAALGPIKGEALRARLERTIERLDVSIDRIRNVIFDLHRPTDTSDLEPRMIDTIRATERDLGFLPDLHIDGDPSDVPLRVQEHLIPALREALTNIARHASASNAIVHLGIGEDIILQILDDGIGYDPESVPGFGLSNTRRRAEALGGQYSIAQRADGGTIVRWVVPGSGQSA
ncbi:MAG: PAS domain-containing sensor histidine kinase [Acidimicrobiales bacterium]